MGTGYVRQSAADIVDLLPITAAPLNAEFNKIKDAMDGSTGHAHDGTSGNGPKINLTSAIGVSGILPIANGGTGATTAPTARTNLGLGTIATQNTSAVALTGGSITGVPISGSTVSGTSITTPNAQITGGVATGLTNVTSVNGAITNFQSSNVNITGGTATALTNVTTTGLGATNLNTSNATITGGNITGITDLAVADGGTGASTAAAARTNLGVAIGNNVQAFSPALNSISGLSTSADQLPYTTGSNTYALTALTTYIRSLLDDPDATTARTTLGAQASLGFTPVQQGTGIGQLTNILKLGWSSGGFLKATVDSTDLGRVWTDLEAARNLGASSVYQQFPGGVIIQAGYAATGANTRNIVYPFVFPSIAFPLAIAHNADATSAGATMAQILNFSNTGCTIRNTRHDGLVIDVANIWLAIGY